MDKDKLLTTYHYESYCALQKLRSNLEDLHQNPGMDYGALPIHFVDFIGQKGFDEIEKIRTHTSDLLSFKKRFFQWFDAFQFIKYLHFMRDRVYPDITVDEAVSKLFELLSMDQPKDLRHSLIELRKLQKGSAYLPYHFSNK